MRPAGGTIGSMRAYLPIILVLLAIFSAGCIAYIAWELSSEDPPSPGENDAAGRDDD